MGGRVIIRVEELTARYGAATVLEGVCLEVREGEIVVIAGASGCGKSTLLKHMIGLHRPHGGRVLLDGHDITRCDDAVYRKLLRGIGILYQESALLGSMTVGENVALPLREHTDLSEQALSSLVRIKLKMVHLEGYEDHLPSELSGGMRKRAGLARAMALNPRILFFDEPSAGLDPITSADLDRLIGRLNRVFGTTMVIVTHELRSIFAIAQRVVFLDKGRRGIVAQGPPRDLKEKSTDSNVRRFFNPETPALGSEEEATTSWQA